MVTVATSPAFTVMPPELMPVPPPHAVFTVPTARSWLPCTVNEVPDPVPFEPVAAHHGSLRAGAGMQAEVGVVVAVAILDHDVMADLPANPVAVVIAGLHVPDVVAVAILQEDGAHVGAQPRM